MAKHQFAQPTDARAGIVEAMGGMFARPTNCPKYLVEHDEERHLFYVVNFGGDGIPEILSEHASRREAHVARKQCQQDDHAMAGAERHYAAQYAHACGL